MGTGSVTHGGTVNVVRWAVDAEVPRVVLASSCAVYGDAAELPVAETSPPRPLSPYAEHKLAAEGVVRRRRRRRPAHGSAACGSSMSSARGRTPAPSTRA